MRIGIIGGSGVYDLEGLRKVTHKSLKTPFGAPSDAYVCGMLSDRAVCFLPRHGRGHRLLPSEINHRANIFGFKRLGVERIISISAVGSLRERLRPRDIVLPDQYFDRTKQSHAHTFFGNGVVAHVPFGEPSCPELRKHIANVARQVIRRQSPRSGVRLNEGGTYVNMEGPAFSTKAESNTYRKLGFDVIGMTSLPEAKLCREAEICYQAMAMVTDYDCWHESVEHVTVEMIIGHLMANSSLAKEILRVLLPAIPETRHCACGDMLRNAILTRKEAAPSATLRALKPIIGKYL
jgi:5'-methylthioadenosine phosphorylase